MESISSSLCLTKNNRENRKMFGNLNHTWWAAKQKTKMSLQNSSSVQYICRYDRGFCRHGPHCRHRHVRRVLCVNYLSGFCPEGPACKYMHPRFELPAPPEQTKDAKRLPVCHYCSDVGHKASTCNKLPPEVSFPNFSQKLWCVVICRDTHITTHHNRHILIQSSCD